LSLIAFLAGFESENIAVPNVYVLGVHACV